MTTRLSISECLRRLKEVIDLPLTPLGRRPLIGRLEPNAGGARLRLRKRIFPRRYTLQTYLIGTLAEYEGGTRLSYRVTPDPSARLLMIAWCVFMLLMGLGMAVNIGQKPIGTGDARKWMVLAIPGCFFFLGFGVFKLGQFLGRNEPQFLTQIMMETLDASPPAEMKVGSTPPSPTGRAAGNARSG